MAEGYAPAVAAPPESGGAFLADALAGLTAPRKSLPPKYFYDAEGSRLFEAICATPEYYPTRTETALLEAAKPAISALIPDGAALVEFGSGSSRKTRLVLEAAPQLSAYVPIDISESALLEAAAGIRRLHPGLEVAPVAADFTAPVAPPQALQGRRMVGFFPGSTIGNFVPAEARRFLARAREWLGPSALFLVGVDLVKPQAVLEAAYDDAQGVTAAFNLNLLVRANRELGADFDLSGFAHRALWNPGEGRVEMHLVSRRAQSVRLAGRRIDFAAGETIHTENAYKYAVEGFAALAAEAGWRVQASWIAADPAFAVIALA
jgi:dimethylhistidine N-methyltransferase